MSPIIKDLLFLFAISIPYWTIVFLIYYVCDLGGIRSMSERIRKEASKKRRLYSVEHSQKEIREAIKKELEKMKHKKIIISLALLAFLLLAQIVSPSWAFMLGILFGYLSDVVRRK